MDRNTVARFALAYERIPYVPLVAAIVQRCFGGGMTTPRVVFRHLSAEHPARLEPWYDPNSDNGGWQIVLDSFHLAEWLGPLGIPITAVLVHELVHLYRIEVEGLRGRHGKGFDCLCDAVSYNGFPSINSVGEFVSASTADMQPRPWRCSMALVGRTATALQKLAA